MRSNRHARSRTRTHARSRTRTHACAFAPSILSFWNHRRKDLFFRIYGSKEVTFDLISSVFANCVPLRRIFRVAISQNSLGSISGDYYYWVMIEFHSEELYNKLCLARRFIMIQKPRFLLFVPPLPLTCATSAKHGRINYQ